MSDKERIKENIKKELFGDIDIERMSDNDRNQCIVTAVDSLSLVGVKTIKFSIDYEFKGEKWRQSFKKMCDKKEVEK